MFSPTLRLRALSLFIAAPLVVLAVSVSTASAQSFATATDYAVGDNPNSGVAADFNADGKPDLAIGNVLDRNVSVLLNNGNGTFAGAVNYLVDFNPEALAAALDSVTQTSDPFLLNNLNNLESIDHRRRVSLFVWRLGLLPADTVANVMVTAED